jgi:hypothetical protein
MNKVEVVEGVGGCATSGKLPFLVRVNGEVLRNSRGVGRRFATSAAAALAGAKEVDRRLAQQR